MAENSKKGNTNLSFSSVDASDQFLDPTQSPDSKLRSGIKDRMHHNSSPNPLTSSDHTTTTSPPASLTTILQYGNDDTKYHEKNRDIGVDDFETLLSARDSDISITINPSSPSAWSYYDSFQSNLRSEAFTGIKYTSIAIFVLAILVGALLLFNSLCFSDDCGSSLSHSRSPPQLLDLDNIPPTTVAKSSPKDQKVPKKPKGTKKPKKPNGSGPKKSPPHVNAPSIPKAAECSKVNNIPSNCNDSSPSIRELSSSNSSLSVSEDEEEVNDEDDLAGRLQQLSFNDPNYVRGSNTLPLSFCRVLFGGYRNGSRNEEGDNPFIHPDELEEDGLLALEWLAATGLASSIAEGRLYRAYIRAMCGGSIVIGAVGGSITAGRGVGPEDRTWDGWVVKWFADSFPSMIRPPVSANKAIPASGSDTTSFCYPKLFQLKDSIADETSDAEREEEEKLNLQYAPQVLRDRKSPNSFTGPVPLNRPPDLVFIEFAINDVGNWELFHEGETSQFYASAFTGYSKYYEFLEKKAEIQQRSLDNAAINEKERDTIVKQHHSQHNSPHNAHEQPAHIDGKSNSSQACDYNGESGKDSVSAAESLTASHNMERLYRAILSHPRSGVFQFGTVYTFSNDWSSFRNCQNYYEDVINYYGAPQASVRDFFDRFFLTGLSGESNMVAFRTAFLHDNSHPTPFGHQMYSRVVILTLTTYLQRLHDFIYTLTLLDWSTADYKNIEHLNTLVQELKNNQSSQPDSKKTAEKIEDRLHRLLHDTLSTHPNQDYDANKFIEAIDDELTTDQMVDAIRHHHLSNAAILSQPTDLLVPYAPPTQDSGSVLSKAIQIKYNYKEFLSLFASKILKKNRMNRANGFNHLPNSHSLAMLFSNLPIDPSLHMLPPPVYRTSKASSFSCLTCWATNGCLGMKHFTPLRNRGWEWHDSGVSEWAKMGWSSSVPGAYVAFSLNSYSLGGDLYVGVMISNSNVGVANLYLTSTLYIRPENPTSTKTQLNTIQNDESSKLSKRVQSICVRRKRNFNSPIGSTTVALVKDALPPYLRYDSANPNKEYHTIENYSLALPKNLNARVTARVTVSSIFAVSTYNAFELTQRFMEQAIHEVPYNLSAAAADQPFEPSPKSLETLDKSQLEAYLPSDNLNRKCSLNPNPDAPATKVEDPWEADTDRYCYSLYIKDPILHIYKDNDMFKVTGIFPQVL